VCLLPYPCALTQHLPQRLAQGIDLIVVSELGKSPANVGYAANTAPAAHDSTHKAWVFRPPVVCQLGARAINSARQRGLS
jgi:hypothetical protein